MGFILSKFRRKKSTLDTLEGIEKEINRITVSKNKNLASQNTLIKYILTYGIVFWLIALGCIYYLYSSAKKSEEYVLLLPLIVLIPCLLFLFRKVLSWWYHRKIIKDEAKLVKLKAEKTQLLDEVMEKETYKVATQILEKFDPARLNKPNIGGGRPLGNARPLSAGSAGMELRKRGPITQGLNSSLSLPPTQAQRPPVNLNQTVSGVPAISGPAPPPPAAQGGRGPPGVGRGGPPLPRPILPRERGYLDKFVEYLVGDGPSNRYALICRQCQSHNGMALREEFEYISYRCCYCHYWNPARKQRPVAPRLPDPALLKTQDIDSSEESSKSEKNSVAGSRRNSITVESRRNSATECPKSNVEETEEIKSPEAKAAGTWRGAQEEEKDQEKEEDKEEEKEKEKEDEEKKEEEKKEEEKKEEEKKEEEKEEEKKKKKKENGIVDQRKTDTVDSLSESESEHIELINKENLLGEMYLESQGPMAKTKINPVQDSHESMDVDPHQSED